MQLICQLNSVQPTDTHSPRDYTALWMLAGLSVTEVGLLYAVITLDTPISPLVHRMLQNPFGVFGLVMSIVTLLCFGMAGLLTLRERAAAKRQRRVPSNEL